MLKLFTNLQCLSRTEDQKDVSLSVACSVVRGFALASVEV